MPVSEYLIDNITETKAIFLLQCPARPTTVFETKERFDFPSTTLFDTKWNEEIRIDNSFEIETVFVNKLEFDMEHSMQIWELF